MQVCVTVCVCGQMNWGDNLEPRPDLTFWIHKCKPAAKLPSALLNVQPCWGEWANVLIPLCVSKSGFTQTLINHAKTPKMWVDWSNVRPRWNSVSCQQWACPARNGATVGIGGFSGLQLTSVAVSVQKEVVAAQRKGMRLDTPRHHVCCFQCWCWVIYTLSLCSQSGASSVDRGAFLGEHRDSCVAKKANKWNKDCLPLALISSRMKDSGITLII